MGDRDPHIQGRGMVVVMEVGFRVTLVNLPMACAQDVTGCKLSGD
jgi:hypothetical protein